MNKNKWIQVLEKELVVALGCTEPISIAYASAKATSYTHGEIQKINVRASRNVIKNAMAVGIPGMQSTGIDFVAALGAVAGDASKQLEVLQNVHATAEHDALQLLKENRVTLSMAEGSEVLFIAVEVVTEERVVTVEISGSHSNISKIVLNDEIIVQTHNETGFTTKDCERLSIEEAIDFALEVDTTKLDIVQRSIDLNREISHAGLAQSYGLEVGKVMRKNIARGLLADDLCSYVTSVTAAGTDARMAGAKIPVMSNSGSGNQGIAVTLPVIAAADKLCSTQEQLIRATTISHLIAIVIKKRFGVLSALCGVTIAGASAAAGITYLLGGNKEQMKFAVQNTLGNVTGMLCDGAKAGCAMKVATCASASVQSAMLAANGTVIQSSNGFIEENIEHTIDNVCRLGNVGSPLMDKLILEMMINKQSGA
ncbi:MAG: serine dehydratase subunit alpha family protein [Bacilli bacterium]